MQKHLKLILDTIWISFGILMMLLGFIFLFIPGPGLLFLFLGLVILAGHFLWAKKMLKRIKHEGRKFESSAKRLVRKV